MHWGWVHFYERMGEMRRGEIIGVTWLLREVGRGGMRPGSENTKVLQRDRLNLANEKQPEKTYHDLMSQQGENSALTNPGGNGIKGVGRGWEI